MRSRDPFSSPEALIRRVYAYAAYRLGDGPDAEDVTNDVFVRALRHRHTYDAERGQPATWMIGIARRVIVDRARHSPSVVLAASGPAVEEPLSPGADVEEQTLLRLDLAGAMRTLSDSDRELIALRYGADLSAREIARLLDKSTHAVEVALGRALERLRERLSTPE